MLNDLADLMLYVWTKKCAGVWVSKLQSCDPFQCILIDPSSSHAIHCARVKPFPRAKFATSGAKGPLLQPPPAHSSPSKFDALSHSAPNSRRQVHSKLTHFCSFTPHSSTDRSPGRRLNHLRSQSANFWTHTHHHPLARTHTGKYSLDAKRVLHGCCVNERQSKGAFNRSISGCVWMRWMGFDIPMRERIDTYQTHVWGELPCVCEWVRRHIINTRAPTLYLHTDCRSRNMVFDGNQAANEISQMLSECVCARGLWLIGYAHIAAIHTHEERDLSVLRRFPYEASELSEIATGKTLLYMSWSKLCDNIQCWSSN